MNEMQILEALRLNEAHQYAPVCCTSSDHQGKRLRWDGELGFTGVHEVGLGLADALMHDVEAFVSRHFDALLIVLWSVEDVLRIVVQYLCAWSFLGTGFSFLFQLIFTIKEGRPPATMYIDPLIWGFFLGISFLVLAGMLGRSSTKISVKLDQTGFSDSLPVKLPWFFKGAVHGLRILSMIGSTGFVFTFASVLSIVDFYPEFFACAFLSSLVYIGCTVVEIFSNPKRILPQAKVRGKTNKSTHWFSPRCPYCRLEIANTDAVICSACKAFHHGECWEINQNRCSVHGCGGSLLLTASAS